MNSAPMTNAMAIVDATGARGVDDAARSGGHTSVGASGARSIGRHGRRSASTRQSTTASDDTISAMFSAALRSPAHVHGERAGVFGRDQPSVGERVDGMRSVDSRVVDVDMPARR